MAITDWGSLRDAWRNWHNRSTALDDMFQEFVELVEARVNSDVRHWRMEVREQATIDVSKDPRHLPLPLRWREGLNVEAHASPQNIPLDYVPPKELDQWRMEHPGPGRMQKFTVLADRLEVAPDAQEDTVIEMLFYASVPPLRETGGGSENNTYGPTNWLIEHYPNVYLWGLLVETYGYLWDEKRQLVYEGRFEKAVAAMNAENSRSLKIGPPTRRPGRTFSRIFRGQ